MTTYILRRILYAIPIVLGTTLVLFVIFNVVPGDPALDLAGRHATPESVASIRKELGLDKPYHMQYLDLLNNLVHLDFGRSYRTKESITDIFFRGAGVSLALTAPPFLLSLIISVIVGMFVAIRRGTWVDRSAVAIAVGMQSISVLVYILACQYFLAYKMKLFPIAGFETSIFMSIPYLVLPWVILLLLSIAPQVRFYRTAILDELYQDYVRTAQAKGLRQRAVMLKHVLKNAMIPIITDVVISIPFLILGALLIESFFGIPGLGDLVVRAIANSDRPVLIAVTVLGTVAFVVFNIVSDVLYAVVDPRVQLK